MKQTIHSGVGGAKYSLFPYTVLTKFHIQGNLQVSKSKLPKAKQTQNPHLKVFTFSCYSYTKTYIWDVSSLESPVLRRTFVHPVESMDHNQYILGDYVFQANYDSGLRILRIDQENFDLQLVSSIFDKSMLH